MCIGFINVERKRGRKEAGRAGASYTETANDGANKKSPKAHLKNDLIVF